MREPSFKWFLKKYVKALSRSGSTGVKTLVREAMSDNQRLREPLYLYAHLSGWVPALLSAISNDEALYREYSRIYEFYGDEAEKLISDLESGRGPMSREYFKVFSSYAAERSTRERENHMKSLIRERVLSLKQEKGLSNYRIFKTLGLNPGNVNSYLKNNDVNKIGLNTARKIYSFVSEY